MTHDDEDVGLPEMSVKQMFSVLMDEVIAIRRELKEDIAILDKKVTAVDKKVDNLAYKVDQNQIAMMANIKNHDHRLKILELAR